MGYLNSIDELSNQTEESKTQIQRYIRLTYLVERLKEKVNSKELSVRARYFSKQANQRSNKNFFEK